MGMIASRILPSEMNTGLLSPTNPIRTSPSHFDKQSIRYFALTHTENSPSTSQNTSPTMRSPSFPLALTFADIPENSILIANETALAMVAHDASSTESIVADEDASSALSMIVDTFGHLPSKHLDTTDVEPSSISIFDPSDRIVTSPVKSGENTDAGMMTLISPSHSQLIDATL